MTTVYSHPAWVSCLIVSAALLFAGTVSAQTAAVREAAPATSSPASSLPPSTIGQRIDENLILIRGNNTPEARKLGALRLLEIGSNEATEHLMSILTSDPADLPAQLAVCAAIADFERPPAMLVEALLAILGDARPSVIEAVTRAIRRFDSTVVVGRLRPIASDAAYARPRRLAAIHALGVLSDDVQAIGVLAGLLSDPDRTIRYAALAAFREATGSGATDPDSALAWWTHASSFSQEKLLKALIELRAQQVQRLRNERSELTRRLVSASRESYLNTPEQGRPRFHQNLMSDEVASLRLLGLDLVNDLITDRKEISPDTKAIIGELTVDPDVRVRLRAARIVGDLRLSGASTKLIEAMSRELDDDVRAAQVNALGRLDDLNALAALMERLNDDAHTVVGEAATAIGTLLRRGQQNPSTDEIALNLLMDRYRRLSPENTELREKFLLAMTSIGAPVFRPIFEDEMVNGRTPRVRRAAITGLSVYEDATASALIRPLTQATEPEIRLAAIEAIGKCGNSVEDLATLNSHLHVEREPDPGIRQSAWESILSVAQRLPTETRIQVSDQFDRPDDRTAQRRRLELLRALRSDIPRFEELSRDERIVVFEKIADAQLELGEYVAASASLEQAMALFTDQEDERYAALAHGSISALFKGGEDAAAHKRIAELFDGEQINGELIDPRPLAEIIRKEIKSRMFRAKDAAGYAEARNLIDQSKEFALRVGEAFDQELNVLREELLAKRNAEVSRLLDVVGSDPDAESKLLQLGRQAVLPQLYRRLLEKTDAAPPSQDVELRLVQLTKRLAPDWKGYEAGCTDEQRHAAMESLRETIESSMAENGSTPSPT